MTNLIDPVATEEDSDDEGEEEDERVGAFANPIARQVAQGTALAVDELDQTDEAPRPRAVVGLGSPPAAAGEEEPEAEELVSPFSGAVKLCELRASKV